MKSTRLPNLISACLLVLLVLFTMLIWKSEMELRRMVRQIKDEKMAWGREQLDIKYVAPISFPEGLLKGGWNTVESFFADKPIVSEGELALIEMGGIGSRNCERNEKYNTGYVFAKTIETRGNALPSSFKIFFKHKTGSIGHGLTPWNNLPDYRGCLNGNQKQWIVGVFVQKGDVWEVLSGQKEFDLSRPEDMTEGRLKFVQSHFKTPLIQIWSPRIDVLEHILKRTKWGMSELVFMRAFVDVSPISRGWWLDGESFRNIYTVKYPNTKVEFVFSGVVDESKEILRTTTNIVPVSSSLISFKIQHPQRLAPGYTQKIVYDPSYLKNLHDAYLLRLTRKKTKFKQEQEYIYRNLKWEKVTSRASGTIFFRYWSLSTWEKGITAKAPPALIARDLRKERIAARQATRDWIPIEYHDYDHFWVE